MRLISCYIENFGGLQNFSLNFDSGITVINEPNGFGKTTLATFIRTMLYGFPRAAKTMGKNDRKKYIPWQGGTFGGNLVFEYEGETYRVERTFGSTPKQDTFALYKLDPLRKCDSFSEQLGQELFGLDADSFERSTYMPQIRDASSLSTAGIQAKLGNLVEDTNDINNYDEAVERLKKERGKLIAYRGNGGTVAEVQRRSAELELKVRELKQQKSLLRDVTAEAEKLKEDIEAQSLRVEKLREEMSHAYGAAVRTELERQHNGLLQEKKNIQEQLSSFDQKYRNGVPDAETMQPVFGYMEELERLSAGAQQTQSYADALETVEKNKTRFIDGVPDEQQFKTCREKLEKLTADRAELGKLTAAHNAPERYLFTDVPTQEAISKNREKLSRVDELRRENARIVSDTVDNVPKTSGKKAALPCVIAGAVFIFAAVVLFILRQYAIGGALLVVGAVALIGAIYFNIRDMVMSRMGASDNDIKRRIQENELQIQTLEDEVRSFVSAFSIEESNLFDALNSVKHLLELRDKAQAAEKEAAKLREQITENETQVTVFLSRYVEGLRPDSLADQLTELQLECSDYAQAKRMLGEYEVQKTATEKKKAELSQIINSFFEKLALDGIARNSTSLREIREDALRYSDLRVQQKKNARDLEEFLVRNEEKLKIPLSENAVDTEALKREEGEQVAQLNEKNRRLSELYSRMRNIQNAVDILPELEDEIQRCEQQKKDDVYKADILDKTMELLAQSKETLSGSYLGEVKERFAYYMQQLSEETGETLFIDQNLEVTLERRGVARELGYFSAGYSDIVMLCMRFALVDALFPETKPFIILDDPFINLDDSNTKKALELLERLGRDRQIVYLVCNSSRSTQK